MSKMSTFLALRLSKGRLRHSDSTGLGTLWDLAQVPADSGQHTQLHWLLQHLVGYSATWTLLCFRKNLEHGARKTYLSLYTAVHIKQK